VQRSRGPAGRSGAEKGEVFAWRRRAGIGYRTIGNRLITDLFGILWPLLRDDVRRMNNMEVLIPIAVFASIISIIGCHRCVSRGQKPTALLAILAAFGSAAISAIFGLIVELAATGPEIVFSTNYWMGDANPGLLAACNSHGLGLKLNPSQ